MKTPRLSYVLLAAALCMAAASCSTHRTASRGRHGRQPKVDIEVFVRDHILSDRQQLIVEEALSWQGTPYKYGAAEKGESTDCSGFTMNVYKTALNISIPRNSAKQSEFCRAVQMNHVRACDLVFFATGSDKSKVSHVGIVLDQENFIHASSSKGVTVSRFDSPYWLTRIVGFGRVPGM